MDEKKIELKPCPFCGGKAEFHIDEMEYNKTNYTVEWSLRIRCSHCGTDRHGCVSNNTVRIGLGEDGSINIFTDNRDAVAELWNRRSINEH